MLLSATTMIFALLAITCLAPAAPLLPPIAIHGDVTIPPDSGSVQASLQIENRTAKPAALDFSIASFAPDPRRTGLDGLVSSEPKKLSIPPFSVVPIKLRISDANFFGNAQVNLGVDAAVAVSVHRGLILQPEKLAFHLGESTGFHVENPTDATIAAHWLLRTPGGDLCAQADCSQFDSWFPLEVGPRRTARIPVTPRSWWFTGSQGPVSLVIAYSRDVNGIEQIEPFPAEFVAPGLGKRFSQGVSDLLERLHLFFRLIYTFLLLAAGALTFWFANVMLVNLQQYSAALKRLNELRERIGAISGATASRTRVSLKKTSESMAERARGKLLSQDDRQLLVQGLDAFERRIQLAEKLDAAYIRRNELYNEDTWPMSVARDVKAILAEVESFVNGDVSVEDLARADKMLTTALDIDPAIKALSVGFRARLQRVQADFSRPLWQTFFDRQKSGFPSADALLAVKVGNPDEAKILDNDPVERDLDLTQLEILRDLASACATEHDTEKIVAFAKLRSEPALVRARNLLEQCQEGIHEEELLQAIREKQWYAYCEPETVRLGSAFRLWIRFSRESLNRCAARDSFTCYWNLPDGTFEEGWEAFMVASTFAGTEIRPSFILNTADPPLEIERVLDRDRNEIEIPRLTPKVVWTRSSAEWKYDMVQMATSLLVPLATVALVEFQKDMPLHAWPLITAGFTSQLIQSRVLKGEASPRT